MIEYKGKFTNAKVMIDEIDPATASQIVGFISNPAFTQPVVIMPDTHAGAGSVIGFTMPLTEKVIPNTVGVDIGCGMLSLKASKNLFSENTKKEIDDLIRENIPFGFAVRNKPAVDLIDFTEDNHPIWKEANKLAVDFSREFEKVFGVKVELVTYSYNWFKEKCKQIGIELPRAIRSLGTLGGGNHFIEIGKSEKGNDYWITIHSGSRNFGKCICDYWQRIARSNLDNIRKTDLAERIELIKKDRDPRDIPGEIDKAKSELGIKNTARGLEALEGKDLHGYLFDMIFAQTYAKFNRLYMAKIICEILEVEWDITEAIETVHNYINFEDFIIRKGAISSYILRKMVIPLNMRDGILLCAGRSNAEWNFSAPHGAGRLYARGDAKRKLSMNEFTNTMKGVFSTSVVASNLDESPMAYKDSKVIEEAIEPTAIILDKIKPVMNLKDNTTDKRERKRKKVITIAWRGIR